MKTTEITNQESYISYTDIQDRIEELESIETNELTTDELAEVLTLSKLVEDIYSYIDSDTLVREDEFEFYIKDMVEDLHDIPWYVVVDWESTAKNLMIDYSEVDFDGVTYYYR